MTNSRNNHPSDVNREPYQPIPDEEKTVERQAEIDRLLVDLKSSNPYLRSNAAHRLGDLRAGASALVEALKNDSNSYVRSAAAEALGHFPGTPPQEIIDELLAAIDDHNDYVCSTVINTLGLLHVKNAVEQVRACLEDANPVIVQAAILTLARIAPSEIKSELPAFLDSPQYLVHMAAVRATGYVDFTGAGSKILANLAQLLSTDNHHDLKLAKLYLEVLAKLKESQAIPLLIDIARHEVGLRSAAVEALIELDADEAAPVLALMLTDPSNRLRRNLIEMMIKADYHQALPLIRPLLKDSSIAIRETALTAVARWNDQASIEVVRSMAYADPNPFVRPQAVTTLTMLLGEEAIPDLLTLGNDVNSHVRRSVVFNLNRLNYLPQEAIVLLKQLSEDPALAEPAQNVLVSHQIDPGSIDAPALKQNNSLPIPHDVDIPALLEKLEHWQATLITQSNLSALDEVAMIDQALTSLIAILRKA